MGGGSFSKDLYTKSASTRAASGLDDFGYTTDVKTGRAHGIHETLDPTKMTNGIREARDSDEHPSALPVAVIFDVTGSMGSIPRMLQKKLVKLMEVVKDKAGVPDPQILVGAVGDSTCDRYPFQVGQFESDNRFDEQLRNIILEGGGGGQHYESYGLAYRFAAMHTDTDSVKKRGKKGYFFTMGDESFWPNLTATEIQEVFGVGAEKDESVADLIEKAKEKWEVYHLFANDGSYRDRDDIIDDWKKVLGERVVIVDDSSLVCETIAGLIHSLESAASLDDVVKDLGVSDAEAESVKRALMPVVSAVTTSNVGGGVVPTSSTTDDEDVTEL